MIKISWSDGLLDYKQHEFFLNAAGEIFYTCELQDRSLLPTKNLEEQISAVLDNYRFKEINLLYSGGLDSELLLVTLLNLGVSVVPYTMRLTYRGYLLNVIDVYYSEKFSRQHGITHEFLDLDVEDFFDNGKYIDYLTPYYISQPHVAAHFWLMEQCDNFPILAGEYSWPWIQDPLLSPHRLEYSCYDRFLKDKSITGIGNFWNHSFNINYFMIQQHHSWQRIHQMDTDNKQIPIFKSKFYSSLVDYKFEPRQRSFGWERHSVHHLVNCQKELYKLYPPVYQNCIKWGETVKKLLGPSEQSNVRFS